MYCLIANFGDDSIALIQYAHELNLNNVVVLSVDTGWKGILWKARIEEADLWMQRIGFKSAHLEPEYDFSALVKARKHFPSQSFHWCSTFLKGLTILNWLDEYDDDLKAIILLPHRQDMSKSQADLPIEVANSKFYDDRKVRYPLRHFNRDMRNNLISRTPFKVPLNHRSLECHPCVHFTKRDITTLSELDIERVLCVEKKIGKTMFDRNFDKYLHALEKNTNYYDEFSRTCSWDYGCGL